MKRLVIDIEMRPNLGYVWALWDQNIGINQMVESASMFSFAAKWVGEKKVIYRDTFSDGKEVMVKSAYELLSEADAVIGWNSQKFDCRHLNREFLEQGFGPPAPYKHLDIMKTAKQKFYFPSNKLDYVSKVLGVGQKIRTGGFELWTDCMNGDPKAWRLMKKYNIQDVAITEACYHSLLPWISNHPNWALFTDETRPVCENCGSVHVQRRGTYQALSCTYDRWHCEDCGKWMKSVKIDKDTTKRAQLRGI